MKVHHEVEAKYDVDPDLAVPALDTLPGVASVERHEHHLEATYFDTADRDLATAGITLRRRTGGDDEGWHLKLPAALGRHEVRLPLGRATVNVPKRLQSALRLVTGEQSMAAAATIRTTRVVHLLRAADGSALAELADDRVRAETPGRETGWREWEFELAEGDPGLLAAADLLLRDSGAAPSAARSKLARALGLDGLPTPPPVSWPGPQDPARILVAARLREQVAELRFRDPFVRLDLPDGVHRMRVAVRRLRTALATFRPVLDRTVTEPVRVELKWLGGELGGARDAEVLRAGLVARFDEVTGSVAGELPVARARSAVETDLDREHAEARQRAVTALDSPRYTALLDSLEALLTTPPWTERAEEPVHTVARRRVRHDWKRFAGYVSAVEDPDAPGTRGERLHEARKAGKRARYAVEPLVAVYGKDAQRFVKVMKRVQSLLGDHHDTVTARAYLARFAGRAASPQEALVLGLIYEQERTEAASLERRFAQKWRRARRKRLRRWLR